VQAGDENAVMQNIQGGEATIIEADLQHLINSKKHPSVHEDEDSEEEEEDDTAVQYCSDGDGQNKGYMSLDDEVSD